MRITLHNGYKVEFLDNMEQVQEKIDNTLKNNMGNYCTSYKQIFNQTQDNITTIVYQYNTLYTETFVIIKENW